MSENNEKMRVGQFQFDNVVFDILTRLLQAGDGRKGVGHLSAQTGDGKWAAGVRWKVVKVALRPFSLDRERRVSVERERNCEGVF